MSDSLTSADIRSKLAIHNATGQDATFFPGSIGEIYQTTSGGLYVRKRIEGDIIVVTYTKPPRLPVLTNIDTLVQLTSLAHDQYLDFKRFAESMPSNTHNNLVMDPEILKCDSSKKIHINRIAYQLHFKHAHAPLPALSTLPLTLQIVIHRQVGLGNMYIKADYDPKNPNKYWENILDPVERKTIAAS